MRHYLEFFGSTDESRAQSFRLVVAMQVVFDPLVVSSVLCALGRIKRSQPVGYLIALSEGMAAWGRLFVVRFIINSAIAVVVLGGRFHGPASLAIAGAAALTLFRYDLNPAWVVAAGGALRFLLHLAGV